MNCEFRILNFSVLIFIFLCVQDLAWLSWSTVSDYCFVLQLDLNCEVILMSLIDYSAWYFAEFWIIDFEKARFCVFWRWSGHVMTFSWVHLNSNGLCWITLEEKREFLCFFESEISSVGFSSMILCLIKHLNLNRLILIVFVVMKFCVFFVFLCEIDRVFLNNCLVFVTSYLLRV